MGDVHVEAHADGVGRDQIIDLAALEHRDLGVAGRRRQHAHHHRRAAPEAAQHFGERVNLLGGESDDGRARRQSRKLGAAGIAQGRKTRAADDLGFGEKLADQRLQRVRTEDQGLLAAAGAKHAVGEDMAALRVDSELGLVDRGEGEVVGQIAALRLARVGHRHALGSAQNIARMGRNDPFLAGQQRDLAGALDRDHAVVDLPREQPQREADDAGGVGAHALDREVGLAGVGRPKDRPDRGIVTPRHDHHSGSARAKRKVANRQFKRVLTSILHCRPFWGRI